MMALPKEHFERYCSWIKASLCDGEDEKSMELSKALEDSNTMTDDGKKKCLKIRASVENVVHALLRVREMSSKLPQIFSSSIEEDDNDANSTQNNEDSRAIRQSNSNFEINMDSSEDPELALAINLSIEDERARQEAMNNTIEYNGGEVSTVSDS